MRSTPTRQRLRVGSCSCLQTGSAQYIGLGGDIGEGRARLRGDPALEVNRQGDAPGGVVEVDRAAQGVVRRGEIADGVAEDGEGDEALACAFVDPQTDRAARGVRTAAVAAGAPRAERGAGGIG
jgi:hypothetical protein